MTRNRFKVGDEVRIVQEGRQCIYPHHTQGCILEVLCGGQLYDVVLHGAARTWYEDFQMELIKETEK